MAQRQSNIELLRCLSMFFILMVHSNFKGILDVYTHPFNVDSLIRIVVEAIAIVGVNCFVLISGYFGIRLRMRSLVNLCFQIYFFALLAFCVYSLLRIFSLADVDLTTGQLVRFMFPVSHWIWFVPCYILLMLFSPILNAWLNNSPLKKIMLLTFGIYGLTYFWGLAWKQWHGFGGYDIGFFVILYCCGHIIHRLQNIKKLPKSSLAIVCYLTCVLLLIFIAVVQIKVPVFRSLLWSYDCPIILIQSIMLFVFFVKLKIKYNSVINFVGRSCFAVLLLHISPNYDLASILHKVHVNLGGAELLITVLLLVAYYSIAVLLDQVRLFCWNRLTNIIDKHKIALNRSGK